MSCSFGSNFFVFANIGQYRIAIASGTDVSIETDFSNEEAEIEENDTETAEEEEVEEEEEEEMLGILSGTTTDDLRMYINRKLETVQNGGHPLCFDLQTVIKTLRVGLQGYTILKNNIILKLNKNKN